MITPSPLPEAPAKLVAAYAQLIRYAIADDEAPSQVELIRGEDDSESTVIHKGAVTLTQKLTVLLDDDDSMAGFLRAFAEVYGLPKLTLQQGVFFVLLMEQTDDLAVARHHDLPLNVYPEGGVWTFLSGYSALWTGEFWRLYLEDNSTHDAPSLESAVALAHELRKANPGPLLPEDDGQNS